MVSIFISQYTYYSDVFLARTSTSPNARSARLHGSTSNAVDKKLHPDIRVCVFICVCVVVGVLFCSCFRSSLRVCHVYDILHGNSIRIQVR